MAWTYTTLKQALQDFTENTETSFIANIPYFVRAAEERVLHSVDLSFFRKNSTGTLTGGDKYLRVPSDFLSVFALSITVSSHDVFLTQKDVEFVMDYNSDESTGVPRYYALYDVNNFIIGPVPNDNYPVELHYYYKPASIVDTETSWLGTNAEQCLLYGSLIEAYTYMKGEADILALYTQRFTESLLRLKNFAEGREDVEAVREGLIRTKAT